VLAAIPTCTFIKKRKKKPKNHQPLIPLDKNQLLVTFAALLISAVLEAA